jgi:hypothetical protein
VSKRLLFLPCLLIVPALALAACGGGGSSDESKVEEAIEASATASDPAACTEDQTQKFLEQTNQESGKSAVKRCEEEAERNEGAESVDTSNVEVEGSTATADVALTGSTLNGQTVEVELVKQGDQWKLNEFVGFTKFDQAKLVESFERELSKASSKANPKFAACFIEAIEEADQAEIEEALVSGNGKAFEEIAENCA